MTSCLFWGMGNDGLRSLLFTAAAGSVFNEARGTATGIFVGELKNGADLSLQRRVQTLQLLSHSFLAVGVAVKLWLRQLP